jgi:Flp pilus assembly pilin Flp
VYAVAKILEHARRFCTGEEGATVVEYVLMLVLILLVALGGIAQVGQINQLFFSVGNTL